MKLALSIRKLLAAIFLTAATAILLAPHTVRARATDDDTHAEARAAYNKKIAAIYNYKFGEQHPFYPSNATTDTGAFIDPKDFPTAAYCGHCHQAAHAQWRESAHSNSNRVPYYLRNVNLLAAEKGIAYTRHCEGCHDPISVVSGALTERSPRTRPYDQDGVTCMVCHSIQSGTTRGTGSYVMGIPAVMVDENGNPIHHAVSDAEILAHLDRHSAAVMKPFYKTSQFCSACHEAALPKMLNDYKWQRAISLYDEWQNSSFAKQSPLPFYHKPVVSTCQTCHMAREAIGSLSDYSAKSIDGGPKSIVSHRWLGANTSIPKIYHYPDQARLVTEFLQNQVFNVDIFGVEKEPKNFNTPAAELAENSVNGKLIAPLGTVPFSLDAGQRVVVSVVIQNKGIGHSHVPEQRDMYESWVDFTVKNTAGKTLYESGAIQPKDDELDPSAHSFTNRLINKQGSLNALHQVWDNRVVAYNNTVQSGRSQLVRYAFTMPRDGSPVSVTATVRYRRFDQHFMDFGMSVPIGQGHWQQPIVDMVSTTRIFKSGSNDPIPNPDPKSVNPEWMRWNNYGIGLLDAQQYAAAVSAFERVAAMHPDDFDPPTNIAVTYIAWEKYDDAVPYLNKSLALKKDNARALYYLALVQRNSGDVNEAIANLQKVAAAFPDSLDAHRELGFSYYQLHNYAQARTEYELVQSIAPDNLAAHYNLAIIYRRLHLKDQAAVEAAYFADEKDDPTASTYALEYLRKHHDIAQESVPWHVHDLDHHGADELNPMLPASDSGSVTGGSH
ncbi:tetratricopeptide repeat protein [Granulicella sp. 5B5]|uniref:tetratricopeptide repeat protein n=1 Tax=Granulicella sp. 5B5 TaxID=1617967 RepID=UPI0015F67F82|nr:tetratricopeptide repeat protein [Granulicella sp. 5B5]QMV18619.1 tetratricopeptide repeat protein [Granulicella sp. 5B5]